MGLEQFLSGLLTKPLRFNEGSVQGGADECKLSLCL